MKVKAEIFQIIPWENKDNFFHCTDYGNKPVDLLHLRPTQTERNKWYYMGSWGFGHLILKKLLKLPIEKAFTYNNYIFHSRCSTKSDEFYFEGLPILVNSPTEHKVGDIIELEVTVKKV